eukprot:589468-Prymnesium_polylepis.1
MAFGSLDESCAIPVVLDAQATLSSTLCPRGSSTLVPRDLALSRLGIRFRLILSTLLDRRLPAIVTCRNVCTQMKCLLVQRRANATGSNCTYTEVRGKTPSMNSSAGLPVIAGRMSDGTPGW